MRGAAVSATWAGLASSVNLGKFRGEFLRVVLTDGVAAESLGDRDGVGAKPLRHRAKSDGPAS